MILTYMLGQSLPMRCVGQEDDIELCGGGSTCISQGWTVRRGGELGRADGVRVET